MQPSNLRKKILRLAREEPALRPQLVRLLESSGGLSAREKASLREASGNQTVIQQPPIIIQQPPIVVNQEMPGVAAPPVALPQLPSLPVGGPVPPTTPVPPAVPQSSNANPWGIPGIGGGNPVSVMGVPERAQRGFSDELLPELERLSNAGSSRIEAGTHVLAALEAAFSRKDMLYNILIRYQSSFESDAEYRGNIERLIESWATTGG